MLCELCPQKHQLAEPILSWQYSEMNHYWSVLGYASAELVSTSGQGGARLFEASPLCTEDREDNLFTLMTAEQYVRLHCDNRT